ncbi:MAG: arsenite S-adenosylmethyltransferase [Desulfatitalea sp. BRH_c12]|nr:MAG: arsenite S-adenosylmethyltransferase [Desulfatitalea sp. BRH_c12]
MEHDQEIIRQAVRQRYGEIAKKKDTSCCGPASSCCGGNNVMSADAIARALGYSTKDLEGIPQGANMGLGCGNPKALAALKPGETVLDLGSGGGFDCFLAARQVGENGRVIGVDMTPEMVSKARDNASQMGIANVEFRLGEIEHLPVADNSVDVILSNCVINLAAEKAQVYRDAFRVLKAGGRLAISDVVATRPLPEALQQDLALRAACVSGAETIAHLTQILQQAGFADIRIQPKDESRTFIKEWVPGQKVEEYIVSATIEALKPA